ncbi:RNA polymerase sigma-70 factor, ECF subfamily [Saccharopolyspora antimicrobica]|uniref:RNA polymerase sigma factor n=2 Tax=Saccharopolyspora antimicrobica TaxID=455193 RepID=A0A1I5LV05_9PSEU|nr:RNA polymerase sigma-70 factor (ECF subfamily) [Saccharopolyspora antimicrobica]SFP00606.1 RNA polymerase sigma-70 factor, ECF subfamily [Saccharopolyspora antimicrobica]
MTANEQLLRAMYEEYGGMLIAFVLRYTADRQRAEDVVQETLLRAWRNLDSIDPGRGDPRSYLFSIARNILIDDWRAAQRRPRLVSDDAAVESLPAADGLDRMLDGWLVGEALQRLSTQHRAVVVALYFRGLSVAETAERLGIPRGTVKSRAYYAVRSLRMTLEEMGVVR